MLIVIVLSLVALAIAVFMQLVVGIAIIKAVVLFLGLQGTIFLASALSPPHDEMKLYKPKGLLKKLKYELTEGRDLNYPINYNPIYFYGGLLLLAISFVLSEIPTSDQYRDSQTEIEE